jgi:putative aminopeptidase FrvX
MRLDLLKRLTEAAGIPGYEDRLRAIVGPELEGSATRSRSTPSAI